MATEYRIRSSAWSLPPQVVAFRGREGISELYRFEVGVVWTTELPFAPEDAVGEPVTLEIDRPGRDPHRWCGVIEEIELVLEDGASAYWRVVFAPRFRRLAFTEHSRIFTAVSVPAILRAVLADEGMPGGSYALRLTGTYPDREHVCQFRESSLDFVRRWAEREGIHWYFEHGEEDETLAFADDSRSAATTLESVRYVPLAGDDAVSGEALVQFRSTRRALPRSVRLHDYDPQRPRLKVEGQAPVIGARGGEVVRWGDNVTSPDDAARLARIRSEELASTEVLYEAHGVVVGIRPGMRFGLVEHPALDGDYLAIAVRHRARIGNVSAHVLSALDFEELVDLSSQYRVDLTAVRAATRFRAASVTPWPRIAGVVTGTVDGPASSPYAQIDEEGRYRVRLHFDDGDTADGSRSAWVRMLQPHGGQPEGMHFPLRKKTEIAVIFLGGDPDRPFILGVAPNPETPSPVLRGNNTMNVIQTGSENRIEMQDVAGGQHITWSTPTASSYLHLGAGAKNFVLKTDGRGRIYTGANFDVDVDVDKTEDVVSTVTETYHATQDLTVTGSVTEQLNTDLVWNVDGPVTHTWTGPLTETIDGHMTETFSATLTTTVNAALTELTYSGGLQVTVAGDVLERFTSSQTTTVNGPLVLIVGSNVTETFGRVSRHVKGTYYLGVSGTYKITTPSLTLTAPGWQLLSSSARKIVSNLIEIRGVQTKARAMEKASIVLSIGATGISADVKGVSLSLTTSIETKATGPEMKKTGVELNLDPIVAEKCGIMIVAGGPKIAS